MRAVFALCVALSLPASEALARAQLDRVIVGDLPNTNGQWQSGEVTVAAPAAEVQHWLSDAANWPARFPDDKWAKVQGTAPDGRKLVQFRSKILGRTLNLRLREQPGSIIYDGDGKGVHVQGRIFIEPRGPNLTHVVMQTSANLYGTTAALISEGSKRKRAQRKLAADLGAIVRMSQARAQTQRQGG